MIKLFDNGREFPKIKLTYSITESGNAGRLGDLTDGKIIDTGYDNCSVALGFNNDNAVFTFLWNYGDGNITERMRKLLLQPYHEYEGVIIDHRNLDVYLATPEFFKGEQQIKQEDIVNMAEAIEVRFTCQYFNRMTLDYIPLPNGKLDEADYTHKPFYDEMMKNISLWMMYKRPFSLEIDSALSVMRYYERGYSIRELRQCLQINFADEFILEIRDDF